MVSAVVSLGVGLGEGETVSFDLGVGVMGILLAGGLLTLTGLGGLMTTSCKEYVFLILPQCIWILSVL